MSVIHIQQIKAHLKGLFEGKIDLSDQKGSDDELEQYFLTRSLAAYAIHYLSQADELTAAASITDGSLDNGIDAIFYDTSEKRLYLCQSKWLNNGKGEPSVGDIHKFRAGITDLLNCRFDKFNAKIQAKEVEIKAAFQEPYLYLSIVLVYTSTDGLADPAKTVLESLRDELNDVSDVVDLRILKQADLHRSLTIATAGEPISFDITLKSWGRITDPISGYYGQVNGSEVAKWWSTCHTRLFSKNIRSILGNTEINNEMKSTLAAVPDQFWYFNNGITIVAKEVKKKLQHGAATDIGIFHCKDLSIVNGAQTVSTIGRFAEGLLDRVANVFVQVRIISTEDAGRDFEASVTRNNNRQNKIENRDFVSLDPEQTRLRQELAIDGINYHVIRSEDFESNDKSFDLVESTTALACASGKGDLVVQLKREIGKLWEDISRAPYRELFNANTSSRLIWRCVKFQRKIDKVIATMMASGDYSGKNESILIHGNRIISTLVFKRIDSRVLKDEHYDFDGFIQTFKFEEIIKLFYNRLCKTVDQHYENAMIPTLFKNKQKCDDLLIQCRKDNADDPGHPQLTFDFQEI